MKLTSLLKRSHIVPCLRARAKEEAIREILNHLERQNAFETPSGRACELEQLLQGLMARERLSSSGLGNGVGYPHLRQAGFENFVIALATAPDGVEYGSADGEPVRLILLAIVPPEKNTLLLGVMACLGRLAGNRELLEKVIGAADRDAIWSILDGEGLEVKESVTAADIMARRFLSVGPEARLCDVALLMHKEHVDFLPVVNGKGNVVGAISARELFAACLPPYFTELPSLRFIRDFDAFEHFFKKKASTKVGEILRRDFVAIEPRTPLTEVIARMTQRGVAKLFVVDGGRLVGVIDNFSIIDKVLSI